MPASQILITPVKIAIETAGPINIEPSEFPSDLRRRMSPMTRGTAGDGTHSRGYRYPCREEIKSRFVKHSII